MNAREVKDRVEDKIYIPKGEITIQRSTPYLSLNEIGSNSISTKNASSSKQYISNYSEHEVRGYPVRATNVFSNSAEFSQKAQIQQLKERIDREYEELNGRKKVNTKTLSNVESVNNCLPKDSSGGNNSNMDMFKGSSSVPLIAEKNENSTYQPVTAMKDTNRQSAKYEPRPVAQSRTERHRFMDRRPLERTTTTNSIYRKALPEENIQSVQRANIKNTGTEGVHGRSNSVSDDRKVGKEIDKDQKEYSLKLDDLIIIEGQSDISNTQEFQPKEYPNQAQESDKKIEKALLEMELEHIDNCIAMQTNLLIESKSLSTIVTINYEQMIKTRQAEISYLESKHKQKLESLKHQLTYENHKYEQLAINIALLAKR